MTSSRRTFLAAGVAAASGTLFSQSRDLATLTVKQAGAMLRAKTISPVDLTEACLKRIAKYDPAPNGINAFITIAGEQAMATAREMEAEQHKGHWRGPLHGIPIALKDNIDTAGIRTTAASELFKDRVPTEDAEVARRLKAAGAILLGKLNMHEFAYGTTSTVTYFGAVHNPWAKDHIVGGSSGGSAAATAADLAIATLGTDTAGSVRIPSSYCGVTGLKATYGRVSIRGVIPLSWSLDHVGPICKTVEDAAILLNAIAGYDQMDPTTVNVPVADYERAIRMPVAKLRLGIPRKPFFETLDPEVEKSVNAAIEVLRKMAASVADVEFPTFTGQALILGPEAYAYHAKWIVESPQLYQPQTRAILQRAADGKAPGYAGALHDLHIQRRRIASFFSDVDLLVTPTMPNAAATIEESAKRNSASVRNTSPFDIFGLPAISVPCGFTSAGLPIGLQISGAPFAESTVIALAHAFGQATEWHTRRPVLAS
jgi:aspartyl-tRNA(Asn)/glutamyl-tRNA(Gln) amidotransferase subunit A